MLQLNRLISRFQSSISSRRQRKQHSNKITSTVRSTKSDKQRIGGKHNSDQGTTDAYAQARVDDSSRTTPAKRTRKQRDHRCDNTTQTNLIARLRFNLHRSGGATRPLPECAAAVTLASGAVCLESVNVATPQTTREEAAAAAATTTTATRHVGADHAALTSTRAKQEASTIPLSAEQQPPQQQQQQTTTKDKLLFKHNAADTKPHTKQQNTNIINNNSNSFRNNSLQQMYNDNVTAGSFDLSTSSNELLHASAVVNLTAAGATQWNACGAAATAVADNVYTELDETQQTDNERDNCENHNGGDGDDDDDDDFYGHHQTQQQLAAAYEAAMSLSHSVSASMTTVNYRTRYGPTSCSAKYGGVASLNLNATSSGQTATVDQHNNGSTVATLAFSTNNVNSTAAINCSTSSFSSSNSECGVGGINSSSSASAGVAVDQRRFSDNHNSTSKTATVQRRCPVTPNSRDNAKHQLNNSSCCAPPATTHRSISSNNNGTLGSRVVADMSPPSIVKLDTEIRDRLSALRLLAAQMGLSVPAHVSMLEAVYELKMGQLRTAAQSALAKFCTSFDTDSRRTDRLHHASSFDLVTGSGKRTTGNSSSYSSSSSSSENDDGDDDGTTNVNNETRQAPSSSLRKRFLNTIASTTKRLTYGLARHRQRRAKSVDQNRTDRDAHASPPRTINATLRSKKNNTVTPPQLHSPQHANYFSTERDSVERKYENQMRAIQFDILNSVNSIELQFQQIRRQHQHMHQLYLMQQQQHQQVHQQSLIEQQCRPSERRRYRGGAVSPHAHQHAQRLHQKQHQQHNQRYTTEVAMQKRIRRMAQRDDHVHVDGAGANDRLLSDIHLFNAPIGAQMRYRNPNAHETMV